jgi:hypothetical protein
MLRRVQMWHHQTWLPNSGNALPFPPPPSTGLYLQNKFFKTFIEGFKLSTLSPYIYFQSAYAFKVHKLIGCEYELQKNMAWKLCIVS